MPEDPIHLGEIAAATGRVRLTANDLIIDARNVQVAGGRGGKGTIALAILGAALILAGTAIYIAGPPTWKWSLPSFASLQYKRGCDATEEQFVGNNKDGIPIYVLKRPDC